MSSPHHSTWEFYQDYDKQWRWKLLNENGKMLKASRDSYAKRIDCVENAKQNGYPGGKPEA